MPQKHVCALCGSSGHNVRGCALPGAKLYREMLSERKKSTSALSKQTGRKKSRLGPRSFGKLATQRKAQYTGPARQRPSRRPRLKSSVEVPATSSRTPPLFEAQVHVMQRKWEDARRKGLLKLPQKCQKCRSGTYDSQLQFQAPRLRGQKRTYTDMANKGVYSVRCINRECTHRLNIVRCGPWPEAVSRGFTFSQVLKLFDMYVKARGAPPTVSTLMAACDTGERATRNLLEFFLTQTAKAGRRMCEGFDKEFNKKWRRERVRFYEADGTGLARYLVSSRNVAWTQAVADWTAKHAQQQTPSYFQAFPVPNKRNLNPTSKPESALPGVRAAETFSALSPNSSKTLSLNLSSGSRAPLRRRLPPHGPFARVSSRGEVGPSRGSATARSIC